MNHLMKIGVNARWYMSSVAASMTVAPVIEGKGQGVGMLLEGWRRMMSTTGTEPSQKKKVAKKVGYSLEDLKSEDRLMNHFESWAKKMRKKYKSPEEKKYRFEIFKQNLKEQLEENNGHLDRLNCFGDITFEEFGKIYCTCTVEDDPQK